MSRTSVRISTRVGCCHCWISGISWFPSCFLLPRWQAHRIRGLSRVRCSWQDSACSAQVGAAERRGDRGEVRFGTVPVLAYVVPVGCSHPGAAVVPEQYRVRSEEPEPVPGQSREKFVGATEIFELPPADVREVGEVGREGQAVVLRDLAEDAETAPSFPD